MNNQLQPINFQDAVNNGIKGKSGKIYRLESELSHARYAKFNEYMDAVLTGMDPATMINVIAGAYEDMQKFKAMDAGAKLKRILDAKQANADTRGKAAQLACALVFNADDESIEEKKIFNETMLNKKIDDWDNYGVVGFFPLLVSIAPGLSPNSRVNSGQQEQ